MMEQKQLVSIIITQTLHVHVYSICTPIHVHGTRTCTCT